MKIRHILLAAAVLTFASCAKEGMEQGGNAPKGAVQITSFRQQVFTRADVDEVDFPAGTTYTLLAVDAAQPTKWRNAAGFAKVPQEGVEAVVGGVHKIDYEPLSLYRHNEKLDFYGLLYNVPKDTEPAAVAPVLNTPIADGTNPTITIGETDGLLKDLMHSNEAKGKSSSDGIVQLPFEHALAAVNFMIGKQDEQFDPERDRQLQHVKVTKIVLKNVAKQATMDVKTGVWTPDVTEDRVVYENGTGFAIPEISTEIGPKDYLVFPTYGEQVSVEVSLAGLEQYNGSGYEPMNKTFESTGLVVKDGECTVSYDLKRFDDVSGEVVDNLTFDRNHKYQLAIFVMRDNVRIVAISPQVYDWLDVNLDLATDPRVTTLGQPITFGGTVWMDRNLGAKSADCEKDWLRTVGYYWEYARNIPFILDFDVFKRKGYKVSNDNVIVYSNGSTVAATVGASPAWPDYFVYTYDNHGRKVSQFGHETAMQLLAHPENAGKTDRQVVAIDPGDEGSYAYIWVRGTSNWSYWYDTQAHEFTNTYWYTTENQPVPKGWRLPEPKDVYSIMPEETFNWYATSPRFNVVGLPDPKSTSGTAQTYAGDYKYQFIYGNIKVDPNANPSSEYSAPIRNNDLKTRLYGIKHQGTDKAYRYMIEMHTSNVPNGNYVRFSQFPASSRDVFKSTGSGDSRRWNLHKFDWEHPSAYLDFPMTGQFGDGTFTLFGREIKIRLREHSGNQTLCMKLSNDGTGVYGTWMCTTCPTRLVRDI